MNKNLVRKMTVLVFIGLSLLLLTVYIAPTLFPSDDSYVSVVSPRATTTNQTLPLPDPEEKNHYIEVTDGCNPYYVGVCVNMREGAGSNFPVFARLRTGVVLKVGEVVSVDGRDWYKIIFTKELLYPERVKTSLYVASGDYINYFDDVGDQVEDKNTATTTKRIVVDLSEEMLYAYDGDVLFMKEFISKGLEFTPTPRGIFSVFKKTPTRYMQGPIPGVSDQVYDLPGVPWDLYFTSGGAVIHGAYWHDHFGKPWSHGCVNLSPVNAKKLYKWASVGTKVIIQN